MSSSCKSGKRPDKKKSSKTRTKTNTDRQFDQLIAETYRVGQKIGSGSYGQIRVGTNVNTGQTVAIKFERDGTDAQLAGEYQVYLALLSKCKEKTKGFPAVYHFGHYQEYQVLVMEMLGRNLESLFESCGRNFGLKSMVFLTLQLLKRFQTIHEC